MKARKKAHPSATDGSGYGNGLEDGLSQYFHEGPKKPLTITLHCPFHPQAEHRVRQAFDRVNIQNLVNGRIATLDRFDLAIKKLEQDAKMRRLEVKRIWLEAAQADKKTWPQMFRKVKKLIPNKKELKAVWEEFEGAIESRMKMSRAELERRTSPKIEKKIVAIENRLADKEAKRAEKSKDLDARTNICHGVERLRQSACERQDAEAAVALAGLTQLATLTLYGLEIRHPEWFRVWARKQTAWPVLATVNPNWEKRVRKQIEAVQLGEGTIHGLFNKERAYDDHLPCRRWALGIVETLEDNRKPAKYYSLRQKVYELCLDRDHELSFVPVPQWVLECAKLSPFGRDAAIVKQWWTVGKAMIREQCPDFHTRPEWKRYEHTFEGMTPGQIQNRIFDDIRKAMLTIAKKT